MFGTLDGLGGAGKTTTTSRLRELLTVDTTHTPTTAVAELLIERIAALVALPRPQSGTT